LAAAFASNGGGAAALRLRPETFIERLFPNRAPVSGLIAPRDLCLSTPPGTLEALSRSIRPVSLKTRARRLG
jgi:hypothetical protein